ncbi:nuclease-related domain-containing protein [Halobacillus mangrovi]|uniref:nuclease-related domain-containing protein n=1 Tax=Halobacillus mangrovi TaxID=402384 RepID=UPI003D96825A
MIIKERETSLSLNQLEALERRLVNTHPNYTLIKERLGSELAGRKGELALNYPLSFCTNEQLIFYDLRLWDGTHYFQNDALILTREWILLIEAKYMAGTLYYDDKQLIRDDHQGFDNPIHQVNRHKNQLQKWLHLHSFPSPSIYCLVTNSHPLCVIRSNTQEDDIVIRTYDLPVKINKLDTLQFPTSLSTTELQEISTALLKFHHPLSYNYLKTIDVQPSDVKTGIYCSSCSYAPLQRHHGTWYCPKCRRSDKQAHIEALKDYRLIFGDEITNEKAKKFLRLDSSSVTKRILQALSLEQQGKNKGRKYYLKTLI